MWSSGSNSYRLYSDKDSETAATAITSEFKLATIFSNFDAVKAAVLAKGGTFVITTNITEIALLALAMMKTRLSLRLIKISILVR